jgi:aconitase A
VLAIIAHLGADARIGHIIEFAGLAVRSMSMAARMTLYVEGREHTFDVHPLRKQCLLDGLDVFR